MMHFIWELHWVIDMLKIVQLLFWCFWFTGFRLLKLKDLFTMPLFRLVVCPYVCLSHSSEHNISIYLFFWLWSWRKDKGQGHCDLMAPTFSWMRYFKNALKEFSQIWCKCPHELNLVAKGQISSSLWFKKKKTKHFLVNSRIHSKGTIECDV